MAELPRSRLEEVIQRAVELQLADEEAEEAAETGLTDEEVLRIGRQVGLGPRHLERAIAEVRAAGLRPRMPVEDSLLARFLGPGFVRASRFVAGPPGEVEAVVEHELGVNERLRRTGRSGDASRWARADGWKGAARRSDGTSGRHPYELGTARELEVSVQEADRERSLVTVTADVRNQRTEQLLTRVSALGVSGLVLGGFLLVAGVPWAFLAPVPPLVLSVIGALATVPGYRREREHLERMVEAFLERLDRAVASELDDDRRRRHAPPFF